MRWEITVGKVEGSHDGGFDLSQDCELHGLDLGAEVRAVSVASQKHLIYDGENYHSIGRACIFGPDHFPNHRHRRHGHVGGGQRRLEQHGQLEHGGIARAGG